MLKSFLSTAGGYSVSKLVQELRGGGGGGHPEMYSGLDNNEGIKSSFQKMP